jgi:hypothetical protein
MNFSSLTLGLIASALFTAPALAHHSFAMFDHAVKRSLKGPVTEVEWLNPHAWVHLKITMPDGKTQTWSFEGGSINQLAQAGWTRGDVSVGDMIEIGFHPLKDGSFGGQIITLLTPGKRFCLYNRCDPGAEWAGALGNQ